MVLFTYFLQFLTRNKNITLQPKYFLALLLFIAIALSNCSKENNGLPEIEDQEQIEDENNQEEDQENIDEESDEEDESDSSDDEESEEEASGETELTIFFVNDQHGQLDNFSKIKHIIDTEKQSTNVLVTCSGDIFSGNPVVDNYEQKGYPMIDVMNEVGFDIAVLGNHEFDYGEGILANRIAQSNFDWVCANVDTGSSPIPEPAEYHTIELNNLRVTFLGLVETNGKENATIPSTHPFRVENLTFERPENVVSRYANTKQQEDADLFIALTHLGANGSSYTLGDTQLAENYPYFDLILGGHSHQEVNTMVNNIPIFQSGANLYKLGKVSLKVKDKSIQELDFELIDLDDYTSYDTELKSKIDEYNNQPHLKEVIGNATLFIERDILGCYYTDVLRRSGDVDITFQNSGGIRSSLNQGDITKREIYEIDPFNNGFIIYNMTVGEIKTFLKNSGSGFYYSGVKIVQSGNTIDIQDYEENSLSDDTILSLGINDYIPAVFDDYFPSYGNTQPLTTAETMISYIQNVNSTVDYYYCNRYFRFD